MWNYYAKVHEMHYDHTYLATDRNFRFFATKIYGYLSLNRFLRCNILLQQLTNQKLPG